MTISGNLELKYYTYNHPSKLVNNGTLTCCGDVEFPSSGCYYEASDNSRLISKKNLELYFLNQSAKGTIEFAGTERQEIYLSQANIIEITNGSNDGVIFTTKS